MKFQLAIIGSPGSGKTVLTTVLSRYLSSHFDKAYMNPKAGDKYVGNRSETIPTISYINEMLETLHRGEWATVGTAQGTSYDLGYDLHIGNNAYKMKLLDSPGEDLQKIWMSYDKTALSPFQQKLFDYISSSNVVVLVVNLDHFADAPTVTIKSENENVLKESVDHLVEAGVCHYILVCFTAYDKYEAYIEQTYNGNFIQYLEKELPMFYRSFEVARKTVVRDYTECGKGRKMVRLECVAVAPVIAQQPAPEINPERYWKPPVSFDVQNSEHSRGIPQIGNWLCECEQSERYWDEIECDKAGREKWAEFLSKAGPAAVGTCCGLLAWLLLLVTGLISGLLISMLALLSGIILGATIGAKIGFKVSTSSFVNNKIQEITKVWLTKVLMTQKIDPLIRKVDSLTRKFTMKKGKEQEPAITPGGTCPPPLPSSGTGGTSTAPPHPSGTGETAATSGSESFD